MLPANVKKLSLKRLQVLIDEQGADVYQPLISLLEKDPRSGVQKLVRLCRARMQEMERERERTARLFSYERQVWAMGYKLVAGLDEAGRGPLAGPVVAAAVVFPEEVHLPGLEDAMRLPPRRRLELCDAIMARAVAVGTAMAQPDSLDEPCVLLATYKAMAGAVQNLKVPVAYLLVDTLHLPGAVQPQSAVPGGDSISASIAAASVVAKVTRDRFMAEMDRLYPGYGFARHKGYGTAEHRAALGRLGPCPIHRRTSAAGRPFLSLSPGDPLSAGDGEG